MDANAVSFYRFSSSDVHWGHSQNGKCFVIIVLTVLVVTEAVEFADRKIIILIIVT